MSEKGQVRKLEKDVEKLERELADAKHERLHHFLSDGAAVLAALAALGVHVPAKTPPEPAAVSDTAHAQPPISPPVVRPAGDPPLDSILSALADSAMHRAVFAANIRSGPHDSLFREWRDNPEDAVRAVEDADVPEGIRCLAALSLGANRHAQLIPRLAGIMDIDPNVRLAVSVAEKMANDLPPVPTLDPRPKP